MEDSPCRMKALGKIECKRSLLSLRCADFRFSVCRFVQLFAKCPKEQRRDNNRRAMHLRGRKDTLSWGRGKHVAQLGCPREFLKASTYNLSKCRFARVHMSTEVK